MITVKCFYENGDSSITNMNCTFDEAKEYFMGKYFNIGTVNDNLQKCVKIQLITDNSNHITKQVESLPYDPCVFQLLYALGVSSVEWECGTIDENIPDIHDNDINNINELGLTVEQRQLILNTLKGTKIWIQTT